MDLAHYRRSLLDPTYGLDRSLAQAREVAVGALNPGFWELGPLYNAIFAIRCGLGDDPRVAALLALTLETLDLRQVAARQRHTRKRHDNDHEYAGACATVALARWLTTAAASPDLWSSAFHSFGRYIDGEYGKKSRWRADAVDWLALCAIAGGELTALARWFERPQLLVYRDLTLAKARSPLGLGRALAADPALPRAEVARGATRILNNQIVKELKRGGHRDALLCLYVGALCGPGLPASVAAVRAMVAALPVE